MDTEFLTILIGKCQSKVLTKSLKKCHIGALLSAINKNYQITLVLQNKIETDIKYSRPSQFQNCCFGFQIFREFTADEMVYQFMNEMVDNKLDVEVFIHSILTIFVIYLPLAQQVSDQRSSATEQTDGSP